jgi:hypothetical protein
MHTVLALKIAVSIDYAVCTAFLLTRHSSQQTPGRFYGLPPECSDSVRRVTGFEQHSNNFHQLLQLISAEAVVYRLYSAYNTPVNPQEF